MVVYLQLSFKYYLAANKTHSPDYPFHINSGKFVVMASERRLHDNYVLFVRVHCALYKT